MLLYFTSKVKQSSGTTPLLYFTFVSSDLLIYYIDSQCSTVFTYVLTQNKLSQITMSAIWSLNTLGDIHKSCVQYIVRTGKRGRFYKIVSDKHVALLDS